MDYKSYFKFFLIKIRSLGPQGFAANHYIMQLKKELGREDILVILPGGIGDTVNTCLFIKEFEKHYGKKSVFIVDRKHQAVLELFGYDRYKVVDPKIMSLFRENLRPIKRPKITNSTQFLFGHFSYTDFPDFESGDFFSDFRRKVLQLCDICLDEKNKIRVEKPVHFENTKKVLLAPETVSLRYENSKLFENIACMFKKQGFDVYVNTNSDDMLMGGKRYWKSLKDTILDVHNFELIVSNRSGLNDLFAYMGMNQIIIYSDIKSMRYFDTNIIYDSRTENFVQSVDIETDTEKILQLANRII